MGEGSDRDPEDLGATAARTLAVVAAVLAAVILAGTGYGFATGSRSRAEAREAALASAPAGSDIFELGQVRAKSADPKPAVVAARIGFPYPAQAQAFREELERKAPALRAAAAAFFSSRKSEELHPAYEGAVKAGLRDAFNSLLSLGALETVWLTDFAVIQ